MLSTRYADNTGRSYMPLKLTYTAPDKSSITFTLVGHSASELQTYRFTL